MRFISFLLEQYKNSENSETLLNIYNSQKNHELTVYGFMGGFGAVRCIFPSTAYESNTVHPRLVAKSKANICTGTHSTHQDRGDHRNENKFNEVMITSITND